MGTFLGILLSSWPHQSLGSSPPQSLAGAQGVTLFLIFFFKVTFLEFLFSVSGQFSTTVSEGLTKKTNSEPGYLDHLVKPKPFHQNF